MPFGFYIIMAAQFFSSLADNALLVAAIALLAMMNSPDWLTPMLKLFFTISYVVLAPFVGAFSDALPKGRVMFISNAIKIGGCAMMLFGIHPLLAYGVVGLGAAAYSPAKYGILTEYLPSYRLVVANSWMEGLTVISIILGTILGGVLISEKVAYKLLAIDVQNLHIRHLNTAPDIAIALIMVCYLVAAVFNLHIPKTAIDHKLPRKNPFFLFRDFAHCQRQLWADKLGQISLATTTLFWGVGAALQFIALSWAAAALGYSLSQATQLQGISAMGIAIGAVIAARLIPLNRSLKVLPIGIAMGVAIIAIAFVRNVYMAMVLMMLIGAISGFFVVPMNALLQHRGHVLMGAGHSIAIQNFNENLSILVMLGIYAALIRIEFSVYAVIVLLGVFVVFMMALIIQQHKLNVRSGNIPRIPAGPHR